MVMSARSAVIPAKSARSFHVPRKLAAFASTPLQRKKESPSTACATWNTHTRMKDTVSAIYNEKRRTRDSKSIAPKKEMSTRSAMDTNVPSSKLTPPNDSTNQGERNVLKKVP